MRVEVRVRRAAGDRAVHDVQPAAGQPLRELSRRGRRDRVQVGDERIGVDAARGGSDVLGDDQRVLRRDDREDDLGVTDDVVEPRQELEPRGHCEVTGARAATGDGGEHACASGRVRRADGAAHRAGADDPDRERGHAARIEGAGHYRPPRSGFAAYLRPEVTFRREVERELFAFGLAAAPSATSPVGSLGRPAARRSFSAICAISSGA